MTILPKSVMDRLARRTKAGPVYNITINAPSAEMGRKVVEAIREYEKHRGDGWRR